METLLVFANESTAAKRRVSFDIRSNVDGRSPMTGISGGQPQVSSDGGAWTNTGIGTMTEIGNGRYYADLTQTLVLTAGTIIRTRYAQSDSDECAGTTVQVVANDPYTAQNNLSQANVRTAVGLASANLDTQLSGLPAAILDFADGVETGLTLRQAQRLIAAACAGKVSGAATVTVVIRNAVADSKPRITATCDSDGNRTAITTDLT